MEFKTADVSGIRGETGLCGIFDSHCHYDDHAFDPDREDVCPVLRERNFIVISVATLLREVFRPAVSRPSTPSACAL